MLRIQYDRPRGDLPAQHTWLNQVCGCGGPLRGIGSGSQYCSDRRAVCVTGVGMVTVQNPEHINEIYEGRFFTWPPLEMRGSKPEYEDAPGDAEMGGGNGVCERCFVDVDDVEKM